jgi:hypothetical protein
MKKKELDGKVIEDNVLPEDVGEDQTLDMALSFLAGMMEYQNFILKVSEISEEEGVEEMNKFSKELSSSYKKLLDKRNSYWEESDE